MSKTYLKGSLLTTTVLAGFAFAAPAYAQDEQVPPPATGSTATGGSTTDAQTQAGTTTQTGPGAQPQEAVPPAQAEGGEIVVTGTLIRNPNLTSSSPVAVVGQEEIQLRQPIAAEQILRTIPGVVPNLGQNVNNGATGFSNVDLRGLGAKRNLVLLDGARLVPATSVGTVDLNNIPLALIDRLDVLTGGASTVYGADAVTGVVNFITKKNFAGVDMQVSEQITDRGDANIFRYDTVLGANFDDGRGNAVISLGYIESDPMYFGDRPYGSCVLNSTSGFCGGDSPTATPTSFAFPTQTLVNMGFAASVGNLQIPDPAGGLLVPQYIQFNFNPFNVYQTPFKRYNIFAQSHYDISDNVTVYGRALYSRNYTSGIIAPSGIFGQSLTVPGYNPFLTPTLRDQLCTGAGIALGAACNTNPAIPLGYVYRRTVEAGPRIDQQNTNMFDAKAGVTWNITDNVSLDVYGAYGESDVTQRRLNYIARSRVQQALNVNPLDPTACATPTGGCVPLNLFGPPGSITPEQAGFIGGVTSTIARGSTLAQVHGVLSADLPFEMPWSGEGPSIAIGAEHRDYTGFTRPDALAQVPGELGGAGGAILPIEGGLTAEDIFGEIIVPVAKDRPLMQELTLEAGYRRSHYVIDAPDNPSFGANTYKIGGTWAPTDYLKFRGNYQQAVRAPNIVELFAPAVVGLTNLSTDPCAGTANPALVTAQLPLNPAIATNANLRAICLAQGATLAQLGSILQPAAGQANGTFSGNTGLGPETAHTITVGFVLTPRNLIPGFNMTLDWYRIRLKDAINPPTPGDVIQACFGTDPFNPPANAALPECTSIRRNPVSGRLSGAPTSTPGLPLPTTNQGRMETKGFDLTANYKRNIGFADLTLNFAGNWTRKAQFFGSPLTVSAPNCPGVYSVNCGIALGQLQPKFSWNQRTTLSFKPIDVSLLWRHLSKFHYQSDLTPLFSGTVTGNPVHPLVGQNLNLNRIPAFDYFDLTARASITDHFDLTLSVFNLFDKDPPIVGGNAGSTSANSGNTFPSTYDTLGRRYGAAVRLKF